MKTKNRETGTFAEEKVVKYLQRKGWEVIERNFHTRFGEIDLICREKDILVFVEVKAKKGRDFGLPEEMFDRRKYDQVKRMAQVFLAGKEVACRIDMVAVELGEGNEVVEIRHYENAGG